MSNHKMGASWAPTGLFVLLWSSGAIASRWGLDHASPLLLLTLRYGIALIALLAIAFRRRRWLPARGTRLRVLATGLLMTGGYSISYLFALDRGVTPGLLASLLAAQPVLTLILTERRASAGRIAGLMLAITGLVVIVWDGIAAARLSPAGIGWSLAALGCMTAGALLQHRERQAPVDVLPLQYLAGLALCLLWLPSETLRFDGSAGLFAAALWLGLGISVGATALLYALIARGNLVNVTSLFYLVPGGTVLLDWLILGNPMAANGLAGLAVVVIGILLVFRTARPVE